MKVRIYGHDYPALVTAASLASNGNQVTLLPLDASPEWVWQDTARKQSGLFEVMSQQLLTGQLHWAKIDQLAEGAQDEIHILSFVASKANAAMQLVELLAPLLKHQSVLVTQIMHGVGRAQIYQQVLRLLDSPARVVVWPEFMSEGAAMTQFTRPDRIIIGADEDWAIAMMRDLLRPYNRARDMLLVMSPSAAELTKYAINTLLALRVSAMNEFANLADRLDVDIEQVRQGIGTDPRIGFNYLYPGAGFGGPNFMADLEAVVDTFTYYGQKAQLLPAALEVNRRQQEVLFSKVWQYYRTELKGKTFALWGVSYKPETATIAEASSLRLIDALLAQGVTLKVHDPKALSALASHYGVHPQLIYCDDPYQACDASQALLIMTEWKRYWNPDFERLKQLLIDPVIFDGRNIYDPELLGNMGFVYRAIGRSSD